MAQSRSVDVLIPVFNAESTLVDSIESIMAQTLTDIRIIVIDDGSTDGSGARLQALAARDPRIDLHRTENAGVANALNLALSVADAEFVARFDADDISYPDRLAVQWRYMKANPDCVAVGSDVDHIDADGSALHGYPRPGPPDRANPHWAPAREPYIIHPFLFARRAALVDAGGYRPLRTSQDSDLYWRLRELGRLHNLPERLGQYRIHGGSVSGDSTRSGRVMAVFSQLAAFSAARREAGHADLEFPIPETVLSGKEAGLEEMAQSLDVLLRPEERAPFRVAISAMLMQLAGYRAYEPELADCRFIASTIANANHLCEENRRELTWHITTTAARLLRKGKRSEALALAGVRRLPVTLARVAMSTARAQRPAR